MEVFDRHQRIALGFSGGKDSLAVVYLLRPYLDRMTVYYLDTGDNLPEKVEVVEHVRTMAPHFVTVQSNVGSWIAENGLPTDVMPYSQHALGALIGQRGRLLSHRYDCCIRNIMEPLYRRMVDDGNTLIIRGTKRADMPTLPMASGDVDAGVEFLYPVQEWTDTQVLDYLRSVGAPISRVYEHGSTMPDCARCSAWWSEGRMAYLRKYHLAIAADYEARLRVIVEELRAPMAALIAETKEMWA